MVGPISAQAGLSQSIDRFNKAAINVTQASETGDLVSLSDTAVALTQAKNDVAVNVKVVQAQDDLEKTLLSILA